MTELNGDTQVWSSQKCFSSFNTKCVNTAKMFIFSSLCSAETWTRNCIKENKPYNLHIKIIFVSCRAYVIKLVLNTEYNQIFHYFWLHEIFYHPTIMIRNILLTYVSFAVYFYNVGSNIILTICTFQHVLIYNILIF